MAQRRCVSLNSRLESNKEEEVSAFYAGGSRHNVVGIGCLGATIWHVFEAERRVADFRRAALSHRMYSLTIFRKSTHPRNR